MAEAPEVSVVVPTRDRWPLLASHALRAALAQEDVGLELIVVDDGSVDGTADRVASLADPRVRLIRHKTPQGVAAARNAGLAVAAGGWTAFLDDDDLWSPRKLRTQLDAAGEHGWVYSACVLVDDDATVVAADVFPSPESLAGRLLHGNVVPGGCSNVIARTELVRAVGGFDETLAYSEDWDLWIRLARAEPPAACDEVLVAHVEHGSNALHRYRPDVLGEFERVVRKYDGDERRAARRVRRRGVLSWLASEHLRAGDRRRAARAYGRIALEQARPIYAARALAALTGTRDRATLARVRRSLGLARTVVEDTPPPRPDWLDLYR
jgi:glycosyltransferase involved in cell wall biosynthesis